MQVAAVPPRRGRSGRVALLALLALLALSALVLVGCGPADTTGSDDAAGPARSGAVESSTTSTAGPAVTTTSVAATTTTAVVSPTTRIAPTPAPAPPAAPTVVVTGVVDGDTLDVASGERVRLIGIDTPEIGQCGYGEATATLRQLVGGRAVSLVPGARDDRDRYGRLLRYVEVDGADVNLLMILSGRATARYDSRDGYGRHTRQDQYVAADQASASANVCGAPPSTVAGPSGALAGGGTDPRFGSCRAAKAAGYGPYVAGVDPEYDWYRDGDGDGVNCE